MITYALQLAVTLLILGFGALSVLAARRLGAGRVHAAAWAFTGWTFLAHGANSAFQSAWGATLMGVPPTDPAMAPFLVWSPALNHSRTGLLAAYFLVLLAMVFVRGMPPRSFWIASATAIACGMVVGGAWGLREGSLVASQHFAAVASWDAVELMLVFAALFGLLVSNKVDRLLWTALSCYAVSLALGALWFNLFSYLADPSVWVPPTWTLPAMRAVFRAMMVAIAGYRLFLAARHVEVPGLFDSVGRRGISLGLGR